MIMNRLSTGLCVLALAGAALGSYACGNGKQTAGFNGADSGSDGGSTSSSSGSSGSGGSSGATATPPDGGIFVADGGTSDGGDFGGSSSGTVTVACPTPSTQNDFTAPVIDTGVPTDAPMLFAAADVGTDGPCMYEPQSGALFPDNWIRLRLRFATAHQENLFEIKLTIPNETSPLVIYTTQSAYTLHALAWQKITSVGVNGPIDRRPKRHVRQRRAYGRPLDRHGRHDRDRARAGVRQRRLLDDE